MAQEAARTAVQNAPEELSALELRQRIPMPGDGRPELPYRDRAWICNVTDLGWPPYYFEYGQFMIKACPAGKRFEMTTITARMSPQDHGEKVVTPVPIGALHIAHDLVRIYNENAGLGDPDRGVVAHVGLFVCETPQPSEEQLAAETAKLNKFCRHLVGEAEKDWGRYRRTDFLPELAIWATRRLKLDKPYLAVQGVMVSCPMCTTNARSEAAICPNCKYVLNAARYAELTANETPAAENRAAEDGEATVTHEIATPQEKTPSKGKATKK